MDENTASERPWMGMVPKTLMQDTTLSVQARFAFVALACYVDRDSVCFPEIPRLARDLGVSARQVRRYVEDLEAHGWVRVHRARGRRNVYTLYANPQTGLRLRGGYATPPGVAQSKDMDGLALKESEDTGVPTSSQSEDMGVLTSAESRDIGVPTSPQGKDMGVPTSEDMDVLTSWESRDMGVLRTKSNQSQTQTTTAEPAPAREADPDVPARHRPMAAPAAAAADPPAIPDPARWPNLAEALGHLPLDDPVEALLLRAHEQVFGLPLPPTALPDVADFLAAFGPALSQDLVTQTFQAFAGERPSWFALRKALMRAVGDARRSNGHAPPEPAHAKRQRALLRAFGVDRGRARDEIVALGLPDAHLAGWGLEIARQQRDGERGITAANAPGALVTALREGRENPPPEPMLLLGRLTAAQWRELVLLARAIHETSVARGALMPVPEWMPPELADVWPVWAGVYTTGAARDGPARHYALRVEGVPAALLGDALAADVDAWIRAHAPAKPGTARARSEAVPA